MAQETTRADRQTRNELRPFLAREPGTIKCGTGDRGMRFAEPADQLGIAEAPTIFAQYGGSISHGYDFRQRDQAQICRRFQRWIARLRTLSEQIEQLAELRFRRTLAGSAVAQHGGKAVVEMHRFSGIGGGRRALPCRSPGFLQL